MGGEIIASKPLFWHESFRAIACQLLQIKRVNFNQMEKTLQYVRDFAGIPYAKVIHPELSQD